MELEPQQHYLVRSMATGKVVTEGTYSFAEERHYVLGPVESDTDHDVNQVIVFGRDLIRWQDMGDEVIDGPPPADMPCSDDTVIVHINLYMISEEEVQAYLKSLGMTNFTPIGVDSMGNRACEVTFIPLSTRYWTVAALDKCPGIAYWEWKVI